MNVAAGNGRVACAVIGTGNIGSDLVEKLLRSPVLELRAVVGIDPASEGLARARDRGIDASSDGMEWLEPRLAEIPIAFEATSAKVHLAHAPTFRASGTVAVDLTPAAVGPSVVPTVNLGSHLDAWNVNLTTCGGQATTPIVAAVSSVCDVPYAEIVSAVASLSAGPGTRQNIDEFTRTTARALEGIGGARMGKAVIILNPAEPPILMRNTVYCALPGGADAERVASAIKAMVGEVASYVPGYRLREEPVFEDGPFSTPAGDVPRRVVTLLEVEGVADYLPSYAGNLDIMTSAAVRVGEMLAKERFMRAKAS